MKALICARTILIKHARLRELSTFFPLHTFFMNAHLAQARSFHSLMIVNTVVDKYGQKHAAVVIMDCTAYEYIAYGHAFRLEAARSPCIYQQIWFELFYGQIGSQCRRDCAYL